MGSPGRSILSPPSLTPLRERIIRLWRRGRLSSAGAGTGSAADPLLAAGQELRRRREQHQLSLRDLAVETRISTAVLEALERGWRDRLPEATYLRTMLPLIERRLELDPGSLAAVLPVAREPSSQAQLKLRRFTPGSIDVFTTWQGTLLYGLLTLGLIYTVNLQQQQLAARGLLALRPISPLPAADQAKPPRPDQALLQLYPELRPLELAARGQGVGQLRRAKPSQIPAAGVLELQLSQPSQLTMESASGVRTNLRNSSGSISLPLSGSFRLSLNPPPSAGDLVSWNGSPLQPVKGQPGQFSSPAEAARP